MSDEQQADAGGTVAAGPGAGEADAGSGVGQILALLVVLLIGAFLAYVLYGFIEPGRATEDYQRQQQPEQQTLFESARLIALGDIMANVDEEQGRRYVKVTVDLWVPTDRVPDMTREGVDRILKQAMEERLAQWNLSELSNQSIYDIMKKAFVQEINKSMREVYGTTGTDISYVQRVVVSNKLIQ